MRAVLSLELDGLTAKRRDERELFDAAFALAYFIHVNKEVAFFVAEDALDVLPATLGRQEKYRKPTEQLRGFFKWGERSRPTRTSVRLNELQMLQWLVYKESVFWERQTERGEGLYRPTEEDLIVRYIEHLAFMTGRRDPFYVTLAVGSLLHQFDRRETRLFYDILAQSDSARMKDTNYIGKQRLKMLERICARFDPMLQTVKIPGDEKQFVMRPMTQWVINLVNECLRRFTPWETACVVRAGFDVTDIPGLYFSGTNPEDEERIALNRIHTVMHPECLNRFAQGLSSYVRFLPNEDQDRKCKYDSLDERLTVPLFSNFPGGEARGDRFHLPKLTEEDYVRLQRTLDARSRRKKNFVAERVLVYVDDEFACRFNPRSEKSARISISPETTFIEVKGEDGVGQLTLAMMLVADNQNRTTPLTYSVLNQGGQKVDLDVTPSYDSLVLEVHYRESSLARIRGLMRQGLRQSNGHTKSHRFQGIGGQRASAAGFPKGAVFLFLTLAIISLALVWFFVVNKPRDSKVTEQAQTTPAKERIESETLPSPRASPSPQLLSANNRSEGWLIARAVWNTDPKAPLRAIQIETTRGDQQTIVRSSREMRLTISLPRYGEGGQAYFRYRLTLSAVKKKFWEETLRAPALSSDGYAHILDLSFVPKRLPTPSNYDLKVEGQTQTGWRTLGHLPFRSKA